MRLFWIFFSKVPIKDKKVLLTVPTCNEDKNKKIKDAFQEVLCQSLTSKKSIFGIKGGLNISSQENTLLSGITSTKSSSLLGFHIGGFFEHKISEKFSENF